MYKPEVPTQYAARSSRILLLNILGVLLLFVEVGLAIFVLFGDLFTSQGRQVFDTQNLNDWGVIVIGVVLLAFVLALPCFFLLVSIREYLNVRELNRLGVNTKGKVIKKWVEDSGNRPVFFVEYSYLVEIKTIQAVDELTFQQLHTNEQVFVLFLKRLPHLSRLDVD